MMNLTRNWWLVVVRGLLAILFGLFAFFWPEFTWLALVLMFGVYAIVDGVFAMLSSVARSRYSSRWWMFLLEGIISVIAGTVVLLRPELASFALIVVIAVWAILTGILEIAGAIRLRREITNEWMLGFGGFVSICIGHPDVIPTGYCWAGHYPDDRCLCLDIRPPISCTRVPSSKLECACK